MIIEDYLHNNSLREVLGTFLHQLPPKRSSPRSNLLQRRQIVVLHRGVLGQRQYNRRHNPQMRDPILLHRPQNHLEIELRHRNNGVPALQLREHDYREAEHVEHGQNTQEHVVDFPGHLLIDGDHQRGSDEVAVSEDHALARARGAGGIQQRSCIVLLDPKRIPIQINGPLVVDKLRKQKNLANSPGARNGFPPIVHENNRHIEIFNLGQQFFDGDHNTRRGVLHLLRQLRGGVSRVDGGGDGADSKNPEETDWELDRIGGENEDDVVLLDAEKEQAMGELGNYGFELGESEGLAGVRVD